MSGDSKRKPYGIPLLVAGLLFLAFGQIVQHTAPDDVFYFAPVHTALGILSLVLFFSRGGARTVRMLSGSRDVQHRAGAVLYTALFLGIVVAANLVVARRELFFWDTTEQKVYTLAPETIEIATGLKHPLIVRGFFMGAKVENPRLKGLLDRLSRVSDKVQIEYIDPEKQLPLLEKFGITSPNTLHFQYQLPDGVREAKLVRQIDEQGIANTLKKLVSGEPKTVYYVFGHGEPDVNTKTERDGYTFLRESIEGENIRLAPLVLGPAASVPKDGAALILAAPKRPLLQGERDAIATYLRSGGKAILISEPRTTDDVRELARPLGIDIGDNVVVDQVSRLFAAGGLGVQPLITQYGAHPITEKFDQGVLFTTTSSVQVLPEPPGEVTVLAYTSPSSWAETDLAQLFEKAQAAQNDDDQKGPIGVAAAFEGKRGGTAPYAGARVVVFGDADFVGNGNLTQVFNRDLFLNALNWVVGEGQSVTVRSRSLREAKRGISATEFSTIYLLAGVLFPELILLTGIGIWSYRRR